MRALFRFIVAFAFLISSVLQMPAQAQQLENIVLLPIEISPEFADQKRIIGAEIQKSLSREFNVFYGGAVEEALEQEYKKEDCTAESCVQNVAILFNGELVVDTSLQGIGEDVYLTMRFLNVITGELEAIKNEVCEACSPADVVKFVGAVASDIQLESSDGLSALLAQQTNDDNEKETTSTKAVKGPSYWKWGLGALVLAAGGGGGGGGESTPASEANPVDTPWLESVQTYSDNRSFVSNERKRTRLEGSNSYEYFSAGTGANIGISTRNGVAFRDFTYSGFNSGSSFGLEIQNDGDPSGTAHELLSFDRRMGTGEIIFDDNYDAMGFPEFNRVRLYQGTFGHDRARYIPEMVLGNKVGLFLGGLSSRHHLYAMLVVKEMPIASELQGSGTLGPNEYQVEHHISGNLTNNMINTGTYSFSGESIGFMAQTLNGGDGNVKYTVSDISLTKNFGSEEAPTLVSSNTRYISNIDQVWDFHNGGGGSLPPPTYEDISELDFRHSSDGFQWTQTTPRLGVGVSGGEVTASVDNATEAFFAMGTEAAGIRRIISNNDSGKFVYQLGFGGERD